MSIRLVMLAGEVESTHILYNALSDSFDIARVIIEDPPSRRSMIRWRVRHLGWHATLGQLAFQAATPILRRQAQLRRDEIFRTYQLNTEPPSREVVHRIHTVNSRTAISLVNDTRADVVLVNGTRIISKRVIAQIKAPMINTHAGITPQYRGVHGAYWALVNGEPEACGVTVHRVDAGVDTGEPLAQALIEPSSDDFFVTYPLLQIATAIPLLKRVLVDVAQSNEMPKLHSTGESRQWFHPTLGQYCFHRVVSRVR